MFHSLEPSPLSTDNIASQRSSCANAREPPLIFAPTSLALGCVFERCVCWSAFHVLFKVSMHTPGRGTEDFPTDR